MAKIVKVDTRRLRLKLNKVNRESNKAWKKTLPRFIVAFIKKGISPVKGQLRFQKYSPSYLAQIKGEAMFRKGKHGGTYAITTESTKGFTKLTSAGRSAAKQARKSNKSKKEKIKELNKDFLAHGKRTTPRNLTLSGGMLKSITATLKGGALEIGFTDKKAEYHNEGAGKLPRRAMLPTEAGEEFSKNITLRLQEIAKKAVLKIFN